MILSSYFFKIAHEPYVNIKFFTGFVYAIIYYLNDRNFMPSFVMHMTSNLLADIYVIDIL